MPFTLYLLALAVFVMGTSEFMLAGLLPSIANDFDVAVSTAGLLTSAFAVAMAVGAPATAALSRRLPSRLTLALCLLIFGASHVLGALTDVFWILLITRIVSALANAGFLAVALRAATALVPTQHKGRALAILLSGTTIATIAGVPAGSLLGNALGWRAVFWAIAALCVPAIFGVLRTAERSNASLDSPVPNLGAELTQFSKPELFAPMLLGCLVNGGTFATLTFIAPLVTQRAGFSEQWVAVALVLFGLGSFIGVTLAGRLADQKPRAVLFLGMPLLLIGWVCLGFSVQNPLVLFALIFVQGILSFGVGSTLIAQVLYASTGAPTMGGSYATMALNIGAALGPVLGGWSLATGFGTTAPVWVAAVLASVALAIMLVRYIGSKHPTTQVRG